MKLDSHLRRIVAFGGGLCLVSGLALGGAVAANAHGYVGGSNSDVVSRAAFSANSNRGPAQYEPQSIEGPKGFPASGPADGHIASGGSATWAALDAQSSTRWAKNSISTGPLNFGWTYTAPHNTTKWHYYMTTQGWDQNAPLSRASLEKIGEVLHDGSAANTGAARHQITIPENRTGYHVIVAVWDVDDTANAFYQATDVDVNGGTGVIVPTPPLEEDQHPVETPSAAPVSPKAPSGLHKMAITSDSVDLMWSAPRDSTGVKGYEIQRASTDGKFKKVGTSKTTSFRNNKLSADTTYTYRVVALDSKKKASPASNTLTVTTPAKAKAPSEEVTPVEEEASASTWDARGTYKKGDIVTHNGATYKAIQDYVGNSDPNWINAPSLWTKIG